MKNVKFFPWVGENYNKHKKKVLLLGESHYGNNPSNDFTIQLTKEYCEGKLKHKFWTNIMQVVTGLHYSKLEKSKFWNDYMFYNYIQECVGETAKIAPTKQMWEKSEQPFFEVLEKYKPTHIIIFSKRLWVNMSSQGEAGESYMIDSLKLETWKYFIPETINCMWLPHPSYGFSANRYHPIVKKFFEISG